VISVYEPRMTVARVISRATLGPRRACAPIETSVAAGRDILVPNSRLWSLCMNRWIAQAVVAATVVVAAASASAEGVASSASSTASTAGSSASNSLEASSGSSSKGGKTAAAGDYRIEVITVAADRPGMVRLALQPATDDGARVPFVLVLPQRTAEQQALARGDTVSVRERAYGFEFARADTRQAFHLVLDDEWHRELDARPVNAAATRAL
jgi:hypothetical protein